jgi:uncharacterized protein (TIGR03437 family)
MFHVNQEVVLDRLKTTLITAFVIALLFAPAASAQATAAKVEVVSGNGQLVCTVCAYKHTQSFYPMVVKVTDANGNPIAGKNVNWVQGSSSFTLSFEPFSTTNSNGLAFSRLFPGLSQGGSSVTPFLQSVIKASADAASISFTETVALVDANSIPIYTASSNVPLDTALTLTGPAGSTGLSSIQIHLGTGIAAFPGISVRILSPEVRSAGGQWIVDPTLPSASCLTGPGADPGSVLTDSNGDATCYPVFGPVAGNGTVSALVGGLDPIEFDQTTVPEGSRLLDPVAFDQFSRIQLVVTQVAPGWVKIVSGDNQTVNPGASDLLVVQVFDTAGNVTIANQDVAWTVAGLATVSPATSKTDSLGKTQAMVTFSPNATGQVRVTAALTGNYNGISNTFTLDTSVLIGSLAKYSGDSQTTQSGQKFPLDLIVQVLGTNNGQPLSGQPIGFAVTSGAATLSKLSAFTDATGLARVTVTAGATPGTVTVNAFIATFSLDKPFTLTVIPPGPSISSTSFYSAGGLTRIGALSPCSLVTVISAGLAPNVQGMVFNTTSFGPWATSLASDTVTVSGVAAPIYSVGNVNGTEQLTFQVPCETALGTSVPITFNVGGGPATINFPVVAASPGIFETVMSDGIRRAVVVRPDGTFVSLQNPARRGENVRVFVTGLGPTSPAMVTGSVPVLGADSLALAQVIVGVNNGGTPVVTARVSPNLIGVYEVTFQVLSDALTGSDVVLSVAVNAPGEFKADGTPLTRYSNGSKLPVQ